MSLQLVKLVDTQLISIKGDPGISIKGDKGDPGDNGLATIGALIDLELTSIPRLIFWVYGDSSDGGTTPDTATQASITALLNAGVPVSSIRWLYETGGSVFVMAEITGASLVDAITMVQNSGVFSIADMTSASIADNITIVLAGGSFVINNITSASNLENFAILPAGSYFLPEDLASASTIDGTLTLVWSGGYLYGADVTGASVMDNVTLAFVGGTFEIADVTSADNIDEIVLESGGSEPTAVSDDFTRANGGLGANWTTANSTAAPRIISNDAYPNASTALSAAYWSANTFADNQSSAVLLPNQQGEPGDTTAARTRQSASTDTYYSLELVVEDDGEGGPWGNIRAFKSVAGTRTQLGADFANDTPTNLWGAGYKWLKVEPSGTTITLYRSSDGTSWTSLGTRTDSAIASGSAGFAVTGGGVVTDWEGKDS